jgi:hypothetical protein
MTVVACEQLRGDLVRCNILLAKEEEIYTRENDILGILLNEI